MLLFIDDSQSEVHNIDKISINYKFIIIKPCYSFVNNITTPEGGTHLVGFKNALTKTFNDYARSQKFLKDRCTEGES